MSLAHLTEEKEMLRFKAAHTNNFGCVVCGPRGKERPFFAAVMAPFAKSHVSMCL